MIATMTNSVENTRSRDASADSAEAQLLVGVSPWATAMRSQIRKIAPHACNVLITGPTGTGKELIAQAIHRHGPRCHRPFIPVDCAAVNGTLFASQMFGHVKGAFTGADHAVLGCFRAAHGGTIFLDEIGELEPEFQAKLLRVLQGRAVTPLGSHEPIPVDVRLIAATNRDLAGMVAAGQFREDLYFRLNVVALETVPLKDRAEDIPLLAEHILARLAVRNATARKQVSPSCLAWLGAHDWPGNVRELENYLERASLMLDESETRGDALNALLRDPDHVAHEVPERHSALAHGAEPTAVDGLIHENAAAGRQSGRLPTLADVEGEYILRVLDRSRQNRTVAAGVLGITRQQPARRIKKHELAIPQSRGGRPPK